jgi:hypothetical protein
MRKNPHRYIVTTIKHEPYKQLYVRVFTNFDKAQAYSEKNKGTKPLCVETPIADHKAFVTTTETMIRMSHFNL